MMSCSEILKVMSCSEIVKVMSFLSFSVWSEIVDKEAEAFHHQSSL